MFRKLGLPSKQRKLGGVVVNDLVLGVNELLCY